MSKKKNLAVMAALAVAWSVPVSAQTSTMQAPTVSVSNKGGPNEVVCEKQEVVGSRLATQRICKTRAQWAEQRLNDRSEIERIQTQRGCTKNGC